MCLCVSLAWRITRPVGIVFFPLRIETELSHDRSTPRAGEHFTGGLDECVTARTEIGAHVGVYQYRLSVVAL